LRANLLCRSGEGRLLSFLPILYGHDENITNERRAESLPDLIIRNGLIVTAERQFEGDIRIRGDKIVEIGRDLPRREGGERELDAQGLLILPGGIPSKRSGAR